MIKRILRSPITAVLLFVAAAGLILYGGIHTVQAAPRIRSEYYGAQVELTNIKTALTENGTVVEGDNQLLGKERFLDPNGLTQAKDDSGTYISNFCIGKTYDEVLAVRNVGTIDQYVRVTVRKYWADSNGKRVNLDPSYIKLNFPEGNGWTIDEKASTPERTVLYYASIINPSTDTSEGATTDTKPFVDKITISSSVLTAMTGDTYDYENVHFVLDAEVDAVQTHNADDAMTSAWGRTNK